MKRLIVFPVLAFLLAAGCVSSGRYNTQRGAVWGAGLGALAGQAIGRNTESTLIGAGIGGLMGTVIGNGYDQQAQEYRDYDAATRAPANSYYRHSSHGAAGYGYDGGYRSHSPEYRYRSGRSEWRSPYY